MNRFRPLVNEAQKEIWGEIPFPPRSIIEVSRLNQVGIYRNNFGAVARVDA